MQRWKSIIYNVSFGLNCLLLFLLIFEPRLLVPSWLQVAGRMHPLILHFPIVLMILAIVWELFMRPVNEDEKTEKNVGDLLLLAASFTAVFTSLMGLFLSKEDGYSADNILIHKWSGVVVSVLTLAWYNFRELIRRYRFSSIVLTIISAIAIIVTGHEGANITHGENFLLAPVLQEYAPKKVLIEDAVVFTDMVKPILDAKCIGCHNQQKAKGELIMETPPLLLKGGKTGLLWDTTVANFGLMFDRIHLPEDQKKHMPPKGKPQLTDEEIDVLYQWVKHGADFKVKVMELPENDSLRLMAVEIFKTIETDVYTFDAASESKVQELNTNYRNVTPLALNSPALGIEFFQAAQFKSEQLKDLLAVKEQIVSLNLNKMPVKDEDVKTIAQFKNLRRLNLGFSEITGASIAELAKLQELKQLSVSGTKLKASDLEKLASLKNLTAVYAWNTGISDNDFVALSKKLKNIQVEKGFKGDTILTKLNEPIIENEEEIITEPVPLKLKHYVQGVTIRYTIDGTEPDSLKSPKYDGKVILDHNLIMKAKAFKPGWITSETITKNFYKAGLKPDSVALITPPDKSYKADGPKTLINGEKGELSYRNIKWLAYHGKPMEAMFYFDTPQTVSSISLSSMIDIGGHIMPAASIEVWGAEKNGSMRMLKKSSPIQPTMSKPIWQEGLEVKFDQAAVSTLKVIVRPVAKLPSWHSGKGEPGWIFVDEVFIN